MHIIYDVEISVDRVLSIFVKKAKKKPRALEFSNICSKSLNNTYEEVHFW